MFATALVCAVTGHAQTTYPPLGVEINADHPLFIFRVPEPELGDGAAYAEVVMHAWTTLPEDLRPFATLEVGVAGTDLAARQTKFRALLAVLQQAEVPTVIRLADADPNRVYPLESTRELLHEFPCIKGILAVDFHFRDYYQFGGGDPLGQAPEVRWLIGAIDLAAQYGRFAAIRLPELGWARVMANTGCKPLYDQIRAFSPYVVPLAEAGGPHTIPSLSALLGLWCEGTASQWGLSLGTRWYTEAHFTKPGEFGASGTPPLMPAAWYRAMMLDGVMTGGCAYAFDVGDDLWFGSNRASWDSALVPLLHDLIARRYIPRKDIIVKERLRAAYQLAPASSSKEFHQDLRDIDGEWDAGLLMQGAYGMERPGQVPELVPNTGRYFWIPLLSPYASPETLALFQEVVHPGAMASAQAWTELLNKHYSAADDSAAFVAKVGRGIFILHTRENLYEEQKFRVDAAPAPVRGLQAQWQGQTVVVTWPFREGDVAYSVYRRILPETAFTLVAHDLDDRQWVDTTVAATDTVAYSVTALTNEQQPYTGTVNYGDYRVLSAVESRIDEEVTVGPLAASAASQPIALPEDLRPKTQAWWPNYNGLSEAQIKVAKAIVARIEAWDRAFTEEDIDHVMDLYSTDYEDPQGWRFQYVSRAYKWFFERYGQCRMQRQIRQWNFKNFETSGQVEVLLYCRFTGLALTDPSGRFADQEAYFPRTPGNETWITFSDPLGVCRIVRTNPAVPSFSDILSFSAGPDDAFPLGPDVRRAPK